MPLIALKEMLNSVWNTYKKIFTCGNYVFIIDKKTTFGSV